MKKLIAFVLVLALASSLFVVFAACKNNLDEFVIPEGGYDGSAVTIVFKHSMGAEYRTILENHIAEFNKLYPNITVKHESLGGYDDVRNQIKTELTGNDYPNMAFCYPDHVALYQQSKKVLSLDSLIASDITVEREDGSTDTLGFTSEQLANFNEAFWNEGKQFADGKMYTLPFAKSTEVLYYNVDVFNELGLTPPDHWFPNDGKEGINTSDHTSMEYVCAKLKDTYGDSCVPFGYDSESNWFITLMEQAGLPYTSATGSKYQFNTEGAREIMEKLRNWYAKGYFTTGTLYSGNTSGGYTSALFNGQNTQLRSYMSIGSSAGATNQRPNKVEGNYPFEVGITTIPQMKPEQGTIAISQGPNICLFNRSNPQEVVATWLFAKYLLTSHGFQFEYTQKGGYVPPIKSLADPNLAATDPAVKKYIANMDKADGYDNVSYLSQKLCLGLSEGKNYTKFFTSPAFPGSSTARDQVGELLVAIIKEEASKVPDVKAFIKQQFEKAINECEYGG